MDRIDLINQNDQRVQDSVDRIEQNVSQINSRLSVVEDRATRRSAFIAAITGFLAGLVGR